MISTAGGSVRARGASARRFSVAVVIAGSMLLSIAPTAQAHVTDQQSFFECSANEVRARTPRVWTGHDQTVYWRADVYYFNVATRSLKPAGSTEWAYISTFNGDSGTSQWYRARDNAAVTFLGLIVPAGRDYTVRTVFWTADQGYVSYPALYGSGGSYCRILMGTLSLRVAPSSGLAGRSFAVRWAMFPAPTPYRYQVQKRNPGSTTWTLWQQGSAPSAYFRTASTTRRGTYYFRARVLVYVRGTWFPASWSPAKAIKVQ
jgi:hypothetical protein